MYELCTRSSHSWCSAKKGFLRNYAKFIKKHLCLSLTFNKVVGWEHLFLLNTSGRLLQLYYLLYYHPLVYLLFDVTVLKQSLTAFPFVFKINLWIFLSLLQQKILTFITFLCLIFFFFPDWNYCLFLLHLRNVPAINDLLDLL